MRGRLRTITGDCFEFAPVGCDGQRPAFVMMEIRLYNTLTRELEPIRAMDGRTFRFYCCGPTVYGPAHIGNFRTFVVQDFLRRIIEASGLSTCHVRNITDVDDKTIRDSQKTGESLAEFTARWRARFETDCDALGLLRPHVAPSAVEHIPQQIELIARLLASGHAYTGADGSVYYRIRAFPGYGKLSGLHLENTLHNADARLNESDEYDKENVSDFALWKAWRAEDGENAWDSQWGRGRPGWHIECSAMAMEYLGESFDLHSGGIDLIFPHHENEIAQSEAATGKPFARHWFHVAHLRVEDRKMSKSLGNLHTLDEIRDWGYPPVVLRYVLLSGHYRQPLNFRRDALHAAERALKRFATLAGRLPKAAEGSVSARNWGPFADAFDALADDLNASAALGCVHTALSALEKELQSGSLSDGAAQAAADGLANVLEVFGFDLRALAEPQNAVDPAPPEVLEVLEARQAARAAKDWAAADVLRERLRALGWSVKDTPAGPELSRLS